MKIIAAVVLWLACGLYNYGTAMAEFTWHNHHDWVILNETPRDHLGFSVALAVGGPLAVPAALFITNFNQHGWTLWDQPDNGSAKSGK